MLHALEVAAACRIAFIAIENLYGEFNSVSITTCFNVLFIAALIWWIGSTKMGKVSGAQVLSQAVSSLRYV